MRLADLQPRTVALLGEKPQRGKDRKPRVITPEIRREYHIKFKTNNPEGYARCRAKQNLKRGIRDTERHIEKLQAKLVAMREKLGGMA